MAQELVHIYLYIHIQFMYIYLYVPVGRPCSELQSVCEALDLAGHVTIEIAWDKGGVL